MSGSLKSYLGNIILADRGFDISDFIALAGGQLVIPAFTRGKSQLTASSVQCEQDSKYG